MTKVLITYIDQSGEVWGIETKNDLVLDNRVYFSMKVIIKKDVKKPFEKEERIIIIPWQQIHQIAIGETVDL